MANHRKLWINMRVGYHFFTGTSCVLSNLLMDPIFQWLDNSRDLPIESDEKKNRCPLVERVVPMVIYIYVYTHSILIYVWHNSWHGMVNDVQIPPFYPIIEWNHRLNDGQPIARLIIDVVPGLGIMYKLYHRYCIPISKLIQRWWQTKIS